MRTALALNGFMKLSSTWIRCNFQLWNTWPVNTPTKVHCTKVAPRLSWRSLTQSRWRSQERSRWRRKAHMNIQNIPYKGVDYTKENYDESFPLLGCLHDQWLLWDSGLRRVEAGPEQLVNGSAKQSTLRETSLGRNHKWDTRKKERKKDQRTNPSPDSSFASFCFCFGTPQTANEQQTTRALHTFVRQMCEICLCLYFKVHVRGTA